MNKGNDIAKDISNIVGASGMTLNAIKPKSPARIISKLLDPTKENNEKVIGMALLVNGFGEMKTYSFLDHVYDIPAICDIEDMAEPCFIVNISDNLRISCMNIIDGALTILIANDIFGRGFADEVFNHIISMKSFMTLYSPAIIFNDIEHIIENRIASIPNADSNKKELIKFIRNFQYILRYIWFVPYPEHSNIYRNFMEEYDNHINNLDKGDK